MVAATLRISVERVNKLVYAGRVLGANSVKDKDVASIGLKTGDVIVAMCKAAPAKKISAASKATEKTKVDETLKSGCAGGISAEKGSESKSESAPKPGLAAAAAAAFIIQDSAAPAAGAPAPAAGAPAAGAPAAAAPVGKGGEVQPQHQEQGYRKPSPVQSITDLGYSLEEARSALYATHNSLHRAIEWLLLPKV